MLSGRLPSGAGSEGSAADRLTRAAAGRPRIVAIGGGTGLPAVLRGLSCTDAISADPDGLTAVVTVTDDGGSSGRLRNQFGVLPPGDVRNCLVALARDGSPAAQFLQHRFSPEASGETGHAVGNLLLTALTQVTGDFSRAIEHIGRLVGSRGRVLPTTLEQVRLQAEMESGEFVFGETAIVSNVSRIKRLALAPSPKPDPQVIRALVNADAIVVGPGSLYTSVLPPLLVQGVAATMHGVRGVKIYIANLMTEPGETDDYTVDDHLEAIRAHTGFDLFDYVLLNRGSLDGAALHHYAAQGAEPVRADGLLRHAGRARVIERPLVAASDRRTIRHDPAVLAREILTLCSAGAAHASLAS